MLGLEPLVLPDRPSDAISGSPPAYFPTESRIRVKAKESREKASGLQVVRKARFRRILRSFDNLGADMSLIKFVDSEPVAYFDFGTTASCLEPLVSQPYLSGEFVCATGAQFTFLPQQLVRP